MKSFYKKFFAISALIFFQSMNAVAIPQTGGKPKLLVTDFNGESFDLSRERGHWVIIHFFASWCPGCKTELPELAKFYQKYRARGLEMIALSPEPSRKKRDAQNFIKPYSIRAALLTEAKINDFGSAVALPTTFLIDENGLIKLVLVPTEKGDAKTPKLNAIEAILNQSNPQD